MMGLKKREVEKGYQAEDKIMAVSFRDKEFAWVKSILLINFWLKNDPLSIVYHHILAIFLLVYIFTSGSVGKEKEKNL